MNPYEPATDPPPEPYTPKRPDPNHRVRPACLYFGLACIVVGVLLGNLGVLFFVTGIISLGLTVSAKPNR